MAKPGTRQVRCIIVDDALLKALRQAGMTVTEPVPFEREIDYFERHRIELLRRAAGKFALVKNEKLVGVFETEIEAVRAGYQQFGNEPFLVKHIVEADVPLNFTAFKLGM